jgi:hypothetical protein
VKKEERRKKRENKKKRKYSRMYNKAEKEWRNSRKKKRGP